MPLNPAPCPQAIQTISKAFEDLRQTITPFDSRGFSETLIEDVRQAALKIEDQLAARQSLRNMKRLMPLFASLEHYGKVMGILCNGTPFLSWVWAPITLILRVASEYVEAFEKIIKGYSKMAEPLRRFQILGATFSKSKEFQQTLAVFYADILEFHKHAYVFVKRSGWKLIFLTSWGRFQRKFNGILEDMTRHEALIDKEANARNIADARQMREDLRSWREENLLTQRAADEELSSRQLAFVTSWLKVDESDQLAIFDALSVEGEAYPGTCDWLPNDESVRLFLKRHPSTALLWLQGIPGAGKSILSNRLIRFMELAKLPVVRHLCNHSFATSLTYENTMQQLVLQLIRNDVELISFVYETMVLGRKTPSKTALQKLILDIVSVSSKLSSQTDYMWIVVDGIDECRDDHQKAIINLLGLITSKAAKSNTTTFKVMISSRHTSTLAHLLKKSHIMSLGSRSGNVDHAIGAYVTARLRPVYEHLGEFGSTQADIEAIETSIVRKSDGMFLYAKLVVDYLTHNIIYNTAEIMNSVNELPEKIVDFYQKILSQILTHLDDRSITRLQLICSWMSYAKRPLRKHELLSALSYHFQEPFVTNLAPAHILVICDSLIVEKPNNTPAAAAIQHTQTVLACLIHGIKSLPGEETYDKSLSVIKGLHGLLVYATEYWIDYLQETCSPKTVVNHKPNFLDLLRILDEHLAVFHLPTTPTRNDGGQLDDDWTDQAMPHWPNVRFHITKEQSRRSSDHTNLAVDTQHSPSSLSPEGGIETTLTAYKKTIRNLLDKQYFSGVSAEHFESFKAQFRTTAFSCRFALCPYASRGFESFEKCRQHEASHEVRIKCEAPDCQYLAFHSRQALSRHVNRHHQVLPPRRRIRRQPRSVGPLRAVLSEEGPPNSVPDSGNSPPWLAGTIDRLDESLTQDSFFSPMGQGSSTPPHLLGKSGEPLPQTIALIGSTLNASLMHAPSRFTPCFRGLY
ncbi:uncharacterized protein B0I36DRAFT_256992 [Microdochium trichocladiopsis]|uniref:NACHT domain-containing protein n=1 Tax=Microdochium trichocladiopsis TaxID=1682393 RepID=A0A9P9BFM1_9PEZI|nr:uncharacterized protein B0I36DRAFT_256992 [Microdochium trichocladiopsis]KAH7012300.1 hypothetical protein B0I36DRAFT_256992 [Microdochium trichocladiopsis]